MGSNPDGRAQSEVNERFGLLASIENNVQADRRTLADYMPN